MSALTATIGSPPNGSSTNRIQPASTATQRPSMPAIARATSGIGTTKRFLRFGFLPERLGEIVGRQAQSHRSTWPAASGLMWARGKSLTAER